MATPQRKLHSLEGIVAAFALFFVLALTIGFAQAESQKVVYLRSSAVMVQDAATGEVVLNKNSDAVVPIASITKLVTAMVILDRGLDLEQRIVVSREDVDRVKGTRSRLMPGSILTRDELLLLALMASENRAAAALGRTYPGGMSAFVQAMNDKARELGMTDSRFVEPTGLSAANVASPRDLVNSKAGYIREAGRCLVMHVRLASKDLIVVLLDSWGKQSRVGDANRIRRWLESSTFQSRQI